MLECSCLGCVATQLCKYPLSFYSVESSLFFYIIITVKPVKDSMMNTTFAQPFVCIGGGVFENVFFVLKVLFVLCLFLISGIVDIVREEERIPLYESTTLPTSEGERKKKKKKKRNKSFVLKVWPKPLYKESIDVVLNPKKHFFFFFFFENFDNAHPRERAMHVTRPPLFTFLKEHFLNLCNQFSCSFNTPKRNTLYETTPSFSGMCD